MNICVVLHKRVVDYDRNRKARDCQPCAASVEDK